MKKALVGLFLYSVLLPSLFAQQSQRLTFTDMTPGNTTGRNVTVNAVLLGPEQHRITIEGNFEVYYTRYLDEDKWTEWVVFQRIPVRGFTINQIYNLYMSDYNRNPRIGMRLNMGDGRQWVRILSIPTGHSSPIWWSNDGRSFFVYYELWGIIP